MATTLKSVCRQARQQLSLHRTQQCLSIRHRPFSSTIMRKDDSAPYFNQDFFASLDRNDQAAYRGFSPEERQQMERVDEALRDEFSNESRTNRELEEAIRHSLLDVEEHHPTTPSEREPKNFGFFQMGEKEDIGPDDEFQTDDISSTAHAELEQTREIREYARNAAWEMPLLSQLVKPFQPPTEATPLRFRYTSYLGEQHPAAKKVVVEFDPKDVKLTGPQTNKLIKLLGPRYNPSTGIVKMSAEDFETQAQNKRYLGDTIANLIKEAKDPKETFEDLPFDFRHHKPKPKLRFPEEWLLTAERKKELEEKRAARLADEEHRASLPAGLVDGIKEIEEARNIDLARVETPIMVEAKTLLAKGKMGKKQMGQKPVR